MRRYIFVLLLFISLVIIGSSVKAGDSPSIELGRRIFKQRCSVCHKTTDQRLVGPGLKGVMERRDEAWVDKWLQNPKALIKSGDKIAVELKKGYFRYMPTLQEMQDPVNRKGVIEYLKTLK